MTTANEEPQAATLPAELADAVRSALAPGEQVAWCTQPRVGLYVRRIVPVAVLLAAGMVGSAAVFVVALRSVGEGLAGRVLLPAVFVLLELPTALFVVLFAVLMRRGARRTAYVITDRRAIVLCGGGRKVVSFAAGDLGKLRVRRRSDGSGDVTFRSPCRRLGGVFLNPPAVGFLAIDDVDRAAGLLRGLAAQAGTECR